MSLVVWLPLTKDLRQQGLDNITVTTTNTNSFQNEGKLSNKSLDVSGHYAFRVPSLVKKRVFSCAFWYKPITDSSLSDNWRKIIVFDTYTSDGSTTGAIFRFESSYGYQSSNTTYCISIHNNVGEPIASIGTGLGETDGWNKWQHIAITADGTTLKCYRNGVQVASGNMGNGGMLQGTVHIGYSGNRPIGRLNDFRLYDHCLSPMEVKELSKGLVLHYPLNRQGWGQENLATNTSFPNSNIEGYGGQKAIEYNYSDWTSGGRFFASYNNSQLNFTEIVANQSYTISAWVYIYDDVVLSNPGGTSVFYRIYKTGDAPTYSYDIYFDLGGVTARNKWVKVSKTFTSAYTYTYNQGGFFQIGGYNGHFKVSMPKVELGSIPTPWCPNSSDTLATTMGLNSTTEYDCSGFGNNGTKMTDTITYTSDTAKYQVSTHFNGTYDGILIENLQLSNIINTAVTYAFWIKPEGESGARSIYFGSYSDISWSIEKTTGNVLRLYWNASPDESCSGATITDGVWQHVCITKNGTSDVRVYINGIQKWSSTAAHNNLNFPTTYRIGRDTRSNDGTPYKGFMSDFRIYATALSADDVKSLYQNSAYIDSSGNVYGAIHEV